MSERPSPRETVRLLVAAASAEDLGFLAAAIAYYAFVSLLPLVILALIVASLVGGESVAAALSAALAGVLSPEALSLLESGMTGQGGRGGATVLGLLVLGWSGLRLFRGLHTAFARIYGTSASTTRRGEFRNAFVTLGGIAAAVGLLIGVLGILGSVTFPGSTVVTPLGAVLLLPVAFFPIYYVLPDVAIDPLEAVPGALLAGLGWTVLGWVFAIYSASVATASVYGAVGAVLLALTWFYAGALLVLVGAVLNAVRSGHADNRQVQQLAGRDDG